MGRDLGNSWWWKTGKQSTMGGKAQFVDVVGQIQCM